jgi:hypothetical protein
MVMWIMNQATRTGSPEPNWPNSRDVEIATMAEFGGVGAISPVLFQEACQRISDQVSRPLDSGLIDEISIALGKMMCPLD